MSLSCRCWPRQRPDAPCSTANTSTALWYLPLKHRGELKRIVRNSQSPSQAINPASSRINSSTEYCRTSPTTRQFLSDIALLFSKERTGRGTKSSNNTGLNSRKIKPKGPSYVAATLLSIRGKEEALDIHVALNSIFSNDDTIFGNQLAEFLNQSPCGSENGKEEDVQRLAVMATQRCRGRFTSYLREAWSCLQKSPLRKAYQTHQKTVRGIVSPEKYAQSCVQLQRAVENQAIVATHRSRERLMKLCKILRACRRIVQFRDSRCRPLTGKFAIMGVSRQLSVEQHVHCEMKLVHEVICGDFRKVFDYIGCTKWPCLRCWYTINKGSPFTTGSTTHWKIYSWSCFASEHPELSRLEEASVELDKFLEGKKKDASEAYESLCPESPVD